MIFVTHSLPDVTNVFTRAISEKWVIPTLDFQLGYFPSLRAEISGTPFYLIDKFNFSNAVLTRIWPHRKIFSDDDILSDIVQLKFEDSWVKDTAIPSIEFARISCLKKSWTSSSVIFASRLRPRGACFVH
jgi:hypothetical protein